jgi:cold shock CspA family protein
MYPGRAPTKTSEAINGVFSMSESELVEGVVVLTSKFSSNLTFLVSSASGFVIDLDESARGLFFLERRTCSTSLSDDDDDDDEEEEEDDDDDDDDDAEVEHSEDDMRMQEFRQDGQEAKKALKNAEELAEEEDEQDDDDGDELEDYGGVRLGDASPWFELTVAETGELYYFNEDTGETSWGHPTGAGRSSDQASDSPEDSADTAHGKDLGEVASTAFGGMVFVGKVVLWRRSRGFGIVHPLGRRDDLQESEEEAGGVATEPWRFPVFAHVKQVRGRKHLSTGSRVLFSMRHRPDATLRKGRKKWEAYDLRRG